jgi:predicted O-linked N-acetylglucosamine transferase (SPINDLY family)
MIAPSVGLDSTTVVNLLQQATTVQAAGRLNDAEQLYLRVLGIDPRRFEALYGLGILRLQQHNFKDAERLFRQAIEANKKSAEAYHYLGFALTGLKQTETAIGAFKRALAIKPAFPEAHNNLGHALQVLGRSKEAIIHYKKALRLNGNYAEAHNNLGNALHVLGQSADSLAHFRNALALRPDYAEAHWNLANALREIGRYDEAIAEYRKSLIIRHDYVEALNGLGKTFRLLDRCDEAIAAYEQAMTINPAYTEAILNVGDVFSSRNQHPEAVDCYRKVLDSNPDNIDALIRRGAAHAALKRHADAIVDFEKALSIDPDNIVAFNGLATSAINACDWTRTASLARDMEAWIAKGNMVEPFTLLGYCDDPSLHLASAKIYARRIISAPALWKGTTWRNEKIRIAYVASGFHQHPTAYLTAELLETHDRSRFEIIGISTGPDDGSDIRSRIIRGVDQFVDVRSNTDEEIATLIHGMQVDIAVDRSGYTANARPGVFARRPGPIQVNYIGFPGSLGAKWYDYVIADQIVLPFDQQAYYTEKIVQLPVSYQGSDSQRAIADQTPSREQMGLPQSGFVFCCFNNTYKITAPTFEIWMRLLRRVDGSVLWLLEGDSSAVRNLRNQAAACGIEPERLIFAPRVRLDLHLARHRLADLFLDTLPYNAHTTANDALKAGLPVVTSLGRCFSGRVAASLLEAIGLPELVALNLDDYEALALNLALKPKQLHEVREKLAQNSPHYPLFDSERYRQHLESAYVTMWQNWQDGAPPRSFRVEA